MRDFFKLNVGRFVDDERGVTLVEYGIALVLAVGVGAGALATLSTDVGGKMGQASTELTK
ncbi:Flp family type IVb pilin [Vannielia litorea]|uniref:Flp family type IVb pilin n=1 Tax=Vannielia litorea TaxID=1217970 RepID=UPI001BD0EA1C|nr:hypothetical protein [Vannielia litorea]MBS8225595.1 Flp family type IVb pilin [Vannielia litorea]